MIREITHTWLFRDGDSEPWRVLCSGDADDVAERVGCVREMGFQVRRGHAMSQRHYQQVAAMLCHPRVADRLLDAESVDWLNRRMERQTALTLSQEKYLDEMVEFYQLALDAFNADQRERMAEITNAKERNQ